MPRDGERCCSSAPLLGLLMGLVIHYFDIQPFIATLAGMFLARGLCYLISVESIPIRDETFISIASSQISLPATTTSRWTAVARRWRGRRRGVRAAPDPLRPHGLRHRWQRELGDADGPAGRLHQGDGLRDQRVLRLAGRAAVLPLHALRLQPARRRHGARRDRRGRHRRHAAHRRTRPGGRLAARRAGARARSRPSSPSTARSARGGPGSSSAYCCSCSWSCSGSSPGGRHDRDRTTPRTHPSRSYAGDGRRRTARRRLPPDRLAGDQRAHQSAAGDAGSGSRTRSGSSATGRTRRPARWSPGGRRPSG